MGSLRSLRTPRLLERKFFLYLCRTCWERTLTSSIIYTCPHCKRDFERGYYATIKEIGSTSTSAAVATQLEHTASVTWFSNIDDSLQHIGVRWHRCGQETHKTIVPYTWSMLKVEVPVLSCPVTLAKNYCVKTCIEEKTILMLSDFEAVLGKQFWLKRYGHRPYGVKYG
jgi:hypothetical protein